MHFFKKTINESFVQVYLVVGGFTSTTELLTEGASAWAFAGLVPIQAWKTVISINNEIITTGDCLMFWPTNAGILIIIYYSWRRVMLIKKSLIYFRGIL